MPLVGVVVVAGAAVVARCLACSEASESKRQATDGQVSALSAHLVI